MRQEKLARSSRCVRRVGLDTKILRHFNALSYARQHQMQAS